MITTIEGLPPGVVGFEASGKLTAADYVDVIEPAVAAAAAGGGVRFVLVVSDDFGMDTGAMWQDLRTGMKDWGSWQRLACVTDHTWMRDGLAMFAWAIPGEARAFPLAEREAAIAWVSEGLA